MSDPTPPAVDVAALDQLDADLRAVDAALEAIDAGDPQRSALLRDLLEQRSAPAQPDPVGSASEPVASAEASAGGSPAAPGASPASGSASGSTPPWSASR